MADPTDDDYPYLALELDERSPEEFEALREAAERQDWPDVARLLNGRWEPLARAARERQGKA